MGRIILGHKEMFGGDGHINYLACNGGFIGLYIYLNLQIVHFEYVQFIACQLYLSKAV